MSQGTPRHPAFVINTSSEGLLALCWSVMKKISVAELLPNLPQCRKSFLKGRQGEVLLKGMSKIMIL